MSKVLGIALALAGIGMASYAWLPGGADDAANQQLASLVRIATDVPHATPGQSPTGPTPPRTPASDRGQAWRTGEVSAPRAAAPIAQDVAPPTQPPKAAATDQRRITSVKPGDDGARRALTRNIQAELKRVGCFDGDADGAWSSATQRAMRTFTERVNATLPVEEPDYILLTLLQGQTGLACGKTCPAGQVTVGDGRCEARAILTQKSEKQLRQQQEAEAKRAKQEAQRIAAADADERARAEKEQRRRDEQARQEAQRIAAAEAEQRARIEKEQRRRDEQARKDAQRLAAAEAEQRARAETEQRRQTVAAAVPAPAPLPGPPPSRLGAPMEPQAQEPTGSAKPSVRAPAQAAPETAGVAPPVSVQPRLISPPLVEGAPLTEPVDTSPVTPLNPQISVPARPTPDRPAARQPEKRAVNRPAPQPRYVAPFVPPANTVRVAPQRVQQPATARALAPSFRTTIFSKLNRDAP